MQKQFIASLLGIGITTPSVLIAPVNALLATDRGNISDRIVQIKTRSGQGSGVIIKHVGNTYTILTAAHVVNDLGDAPLEIVTPDLQQHTATPHEVKIAPDAIDLATISFQSDRDYIVAKLGDSNTITKGQRIFAAGFQGKLLKFHPGTVVAIGHQSHDNGYGVVIGTADIFPGMSGGGLFNETGNLIGINGKSIGTTDAATNQLKPVSGLSIPINTFAQIASQLNVDVGNKLPVPVSSELTADDFFITAQNKSQKGNYQGAIADYDRALSMNPNFGEVYFRRGLARSLIKDWRGAESDYTQAISIKPGHAEAYLHRGGIRNILNNWQGAKSDFDIVLAFSPNNLAAYIGRGVARCELDDYRGGLQDYNRAIALNSTYAEAYTRRGFAYYKLGNRQGAIDNYIAAAELYQKQGKDSEYLETVGKLKQLVGK